MDFYIFYAYFYCFYVCFNTNYVYWLGDAIYGVHYFSGSGVNAGIATSKKLIDKHASENVVKILVANKCDVSGDKRVVSRERAQAQADEFGLKIMETSALSGLNVEDVFFEMGKLALERIESEKEESTIEIGETLDYEINYFDLEIEEEIEN